MDDQCVLEYFEDELSSVAKGEINVAGAEIRAGFSVKDREDCFSVKALTGEELILQAPRHRESTGSGSLDAGELWVDHLRRIARMAILEQGVLQKMMSIRKVRDACVSLQLCLLTLPSISRRNGRIGTAV